MHATRALLAQHETDLGHQQRLGRTAKDCTTNLHENSAKKFCKGNLPIDVVSCIPTVPT